MARRAYNLIMSGSGFIIAIPARFAATRLPGKPLRSLAGTPLIAHVARRALAAGAERVWVAVDDPRIAEALVGIDVQVAMTSDRHLSGSDRLAECADIAGWDDDAIVVNLQGDEPFAPAAGIGEVAAVLQRSAAPMATLATPIETREQLLDPNVVKLVRAESGDALYFSRAPIPWWRAAPEPPQLPPPPEMVLRHIGIYAYRAGFLRRFSRLPPGRLERLESLEQLRALEHGARIATALTPAPFPSGIDTERDLAQAQAWLEQHGHG